MLITLKPEERFTGPSAELPCILSISIGAAHQAKAVANRITGTVFTKSLDHLILASADNVATLGQLCIALSKSGINYGMIPRVLPIKEEERLVLVNGEYTLTVPITIDYAKTFQRVNVHRNADGVIDYSLQRFKQEIKGTSVSIEREPSVSFGRNLKTLCDKVRGGRKKASDGLRAFINEIIDTVMMKVIRKEEQKAKEEAEKEKRMTKAQSAVDFINTTEIAYDVTDVASNTIESISSQKNANHFNPPSIKKK